MYLNTAQLSVCMCQAIAFILCCGAYIIPRRSNGAPSNQMSCWYTNCGVLKRSLLRLKIRERERERERLCFSLIAMAMIFALNRIGM